MTKKQKLELTWIGKEKRPKLEPRILLEDSAKSYHAKERVSDDDIFDNRLIFGDNLLALKALEQEFAGKVKCVFIDPPYNTFSAFKDYDDGIEHSLWLGLMRDRLEIIRNLMSEDGSLWITIDDNEVHYLKVICDEIFGRLNFFANLVWQSKDTPGNNSSGIAQTHNHVLVYRKKEFKPNLLARSEKQIGNYTNPDLDPRGPWLGTPMTRAEHRDRDYYALKNLIGKEVYPPKGSSWRRPPDKIHELLAENRIYWGKKGDAEFPVEKKFLSEVKDGVVNQTWWPYEFAGSTRNASAELKGIFDGNKSFDTPKPEKLILRILEMATNEGDLVLDSFAGSGTTAAVAHKMGRRWITVELVENSVEAYIIPRLKKVIDGEDKGGITDGVGWKGGGGFRYYSLAPSLLEKDKWGNWVISKEFNPTQLSQALCKLEGFTYAPSDTIFWQHGHSTETDFIYVTTQSLTSEQLQDLNDQVGPNRSLLVLCSSFKGDADRFASLTVKKIPRAVLSKCEWGHDDYSLNVQNLPMATEDPEPIKPSTKQKGTPQPSLFDDNSGEG